jgi:hypothetical protein
LRISLESETAVRDGDPRTVILDETREWGADPQTGHFQKLSTQAIQHVVNCSHNDDQVDEVTSVDSMEN